MTTPLPAARPSALRTTGKWKEFQRGQCIVERSSLLGARRWNIRPFKELFGEDFGAFEPGGSLGGTDDAETTTPEFIYHALDQRSFGADDGEVHLQCLRHVRITRDTYGRRREAYGHLGNARVAGAGKDGFDVGRFPQAPR